MKSYITHLLFILHFVPSYLIGSAWVQPEGQAFVAYEYFTYKTAQYYSIGGTITPSNNLFDKKENNLYMEYGLTETNTLSAKFLWANIYQTVEGKTVGFEDMEFGWRHQVKKTGDHVFSLQFTGIIPGGPPDKPVLRYAKYAGQLDFMYGRSFKIHDHYGFFNTEIGYRVYQGYPSDQVRGIVSAGFNITQKLQLLSALYLEYGIWNGTPINFADNFNVLQNPNYRLLKWDITARWRICKKYSLVFGWYRDIWGRNVGSNGGVHGGIWAEF